MEGNLSKCWNGYSHRISVIIYEINCYKVYDINEILFRNINMARDTPILHSGCLTYYIRLE